MPGDKVPAETLFVMNARYATPLVFWVLEAPPPQLRHIRLAGSRNNRRIRTFFKPGTPTSCRIITWMQGKDYSKGRKLRLRARLSNWAAEACGEHLNRHL